MKRKRPVRWEIDSKGRVVGNELSDFLGVPVHTRDDYLARVHPEDLPYIERKLRRAMVTGEIYYGTVRVRFGDGKDRLIQFAGEVRVIDGQIDRILGKVCLLGECEEDREIHPWNFTESEE
jgi:PAS domain-containing protein